MLMKNTDLGNQVPLEFSITVKVQRENRFSVAAHNELILNMVRMGMLTADVGMELMLFDGKAQAQALMQKKLEEMKEEAEKNEAKAQPAEAQIIQRTPIADELMNIGV